MVAVPFYLASVGLVVAGLLGFQSFWIWLVACFVALTSWIYFGSRALRPKNLNPDSPPYFFTEAEVRMVMRHPIYFSTPFSAKAFAGAISVMQLSELAAVVVLLFHTEWLAALVTAAVFPIGALMQGFVNPGGLLGYHQTRGGLRPEAQAQLSVIESANRKIIGARQAGRAANGTS